MKTAAKTGQSGAYVVVVVDDSQSVLTVMEWALTDQGYAVYPFSDAATALHYIRDNAVDMVISDLDMPTMDGMEFLRSLRGGGWKGLFCFLTGRRAALNRQEMKELDVAASIDKPFELRDLEHTIQHLLRRQSCA